MTTAYMVIVLLVPIYYSGNDTVAMTTLDMPSVEVCEREAAAMRAKLKPLSRASIHITCGSRQP